MGNIALINATAVREQALRPLLDGASSLSRAIAFGQGLPGVEEVVLLVSEGASSPPAGPVTTEVRPSWLPGDILRVLSEKSKGRQDVFYFFGDCPFLDSELAARMHANHRRYFADYTFADGYPYGLAPEILTAETAGRLASMAAKEAPAVGRGMVFELIQRDINSFDIETELAPKDQRLLRVSFTADSQRNFLLLKRAVELGARDAPTATRVLEDHPGIMRTLPAFFPIQIVERCPHACSYCPYPRLAGDVLSKRGLMSVDSFAVLVEKISRFCGDAVIDVSLWGEPGLHPQIFDIVRAVLAVPGLDLVVETSGVGWDPAVLARIKAEIPRSPTWILSLDAASEGVYRQLRGEGFAESRRTADTVLSLFPGSVHVQAVRMKENEEDLETFYSAWKKRTPNVIIQKYDDFSGFLPDRKVADLSPLKRFPCWHLKRDFPVLIDGTVPLCREDLRKEHVLGNLLTDEAAAIWKAGEPIHRRHLAAEYPKICSACDEWYTYNF